MCFSDSGDRFDTPLHYTQTTFNIFAHVVTPPCMHANPQHTNPKAAAPFKHCHVGYQKFCHSPFFSKGRMNKAYLIIFEKCTIQMCIMICQSDLI